MPERKRNKKLVEDAAAQGAAMEQKGNREFAEELRDRLNALISYYDKDVARDIRKLLEERVHVCAATSEHPTIQCTESRMLGILGLLNGVIALDDACKPQPKIAIRIQADDTYEFVVLVG